MPEANGDQLWAKDLPLDAAIHRFTVGKDPITDLALVPYDALGSAAHARMLGACGLLKSEDVHALVKALQRIWNLSRQGAFSIRPEQEDGHTAIEAQITKRLGEAGRRIHLGRSRNDQVILALRLLMRERVLALGEALAEVAGAFLAFAETQEAQPLPGYTHLRRAMPATWGMWGSAFLEGLLEELAALPGLYARLDRCPLGAAAGFGVPLALDRELTARLLGFSGVQRSPIEVQNSRGRHESAVMAWLVSAAGTLEKALWDLALFSTSEFGFLSLPDAFTTGSSLMPQKRNPDVVELARGRCRELRGWAGMLAHLAGGLPSSYHRDAQLLKQPLLEGLACAEGLFDATARLVPSLRIDEARCAAACTDELWAAHAACARAAEGLPFRDAYREVAAELAEGRFIPDRAALTGAHTGSAARLGLADSAAELAQHRTWIQERRAFLTTTTDHLWNLEQP